MAYLKPRRVNVNMAVTGRVEVWAFRPAPSGIGRPAGRMNGWMMLPPRMVILLHPPIEGSADLRLLEIHVRGCERRLGLGYLGRNQNGDPKPGGILGGGRRRDQSHSVLCCILEKDQDDRTEPNADRTCSAADLGPSSSGSRPKSPQWSSWLSLASQTVLIR
jgi:hypothetical protein